MKRELVFTCLLLLITTTVISQKFVVVSKGYKKEVVKVDSITNEYSSNNFFVIYSKDVDTISTALKGCLVYLENVGRRGINFTEIIAGNTKIKITSVPVMNGDRYSISAETNYDVRVSRILFGSLENSNRNTANNIKKYINSILPNSFRKVGFSHPSQ